MDQAVVTSTGSEPIILDVPGLAEAEPCTSMPSLVVLGVGSVGCEMATAYMISWSRHYHDYLVIRTLRSEIR